MLSEDIVHENLFPVSFASCNKVGRAQLNDDDDDDAQAKLCRISTLLTRNFFFLARSSFPSTLLLFFDKNVTEIISNLDLQIIINSEKIKKPFFSIFLTIYFF